MQASGELGERERDGGEVSASLSMPARRERLGIYIFMGALQSFL